MASTAAKIAALMSQPSRPGVWFAPQAVIYRGGAWGPPAPGEEPAPGDEERTRSKSTSVASTEERMDSLPSQRTATTELPLAP